MKESLDKVGSIGCLISAIAAAVPCCLPFLASVAGVIGLSSFAPYSSYIVYAVQGFGLLAVVGAFLAFRKHGTIWPFLLAMISVTAIVYVYNFSLIPLLLYSGLTGLVISAFWNIFEARKCGQCQTGA